MRFLLECALSETKELEQTWSTKSTSARYRSYVENGETRAAELYAHATGNPVSTPPRPAKLVWATAITASTFSGGDDGDLEDDSEVDDDYIDFRNVVNPAQVIMDDIANENGEFDSDDDDNVLGKSRVEKLQPINVDLVVRKMVSNVRHVMIPSGQLLKSNQHSYTCPLTPPFSNVLNLLTRWVLQQIWNDMFSVSILVLVSKHAISFFLRKTLVYWARLLPE